MSLEALAMAGMDYEECGMTMEEWELSESTTPPHLLADEEDKEESGDHTNLQQVEFEALAMAGMDYEECGMTMEEWELSESTTPPHLLADEEDKEESGDHTNLQQVEVPLALCLKVEDLSRAKCNLRKDKLPIIISKVKKAKLVLKQLSSKNTMMIDIMGRYLSYAGLGLGQLNTKDVPVFKPRHF
ncbi:hypothetical protein ACET3Z_003251 [Daucus carota]